MRAKQFIIEYNQAKTAQVLGEKLLQGFSWAEDPVSLGRTFYDPWTIQQMAFDPNKYPDKSWAMHVFGQEVKVNKQNALEIYQQIKPKLISALLTVLESADPTRNKEYSQWIARTYAQGQMPIEDVTSTIAEYLHKFDVIKRRRQLTPPANDINQYKSFPQFMTVMDKYEMPEDDSVDRGTANTVFDDSKVRVIVPEDQTAACYYGRGTRWCTAATRGQNYFDHYARQGRLYILLPKQPMHPGEKYQLHFGTSQYMDEQDNPVDLHSLLTEHFPELHKFFLYAEPELRNNIFFADDAVVDSVLQSCNTAIQDAINEYVNEVEMDDDYWYQYLRDKYPSEQELHDIDWDAVAASGESYLSNNTELATQVDQVEEALPKNAVELRSAMTELLTHGPDLNPILTELDKFLESWAENAVSSRNRHHGDLGVHVAKWIGDHLQIQQSPSGQFHVRTIHHTHGKKPRITNY